MDVHYLAIDGGGTKTDAVLFSASGQIVGRAIGEGTNPNGMEFGRVTDHFRKLFSQLFASGRPVEIAGCFAGLSGSDSPELAGKLAESLRSACPTPIKRLKVGNDALNALWSGTDGKPGLVVIAGTGSIAFGIKPNGDSFRIGGWGYLFGDEGSGYDIGRETIRHVLMAVDGREKKTALTEALIGYFKVSHITDIIPIVYSCTKNVIAGLVPLVVHEAEQGDALAGQILNDTAEKLIHLIKSGINRFEQVPDTVLAGGVWKCRMIRERVCAEIDAPVIFPNCPPVYGSIAKCVYEWEHQQAGLLGVLKKQLIGSAD
ncbi:hypothetical protein EWI07_08210 [Sporolactobacillus sp. THM7-4]|nr:hypothetical protein EWI07_08210 [Sporolactobacillus sp. THM7-4]